MSSEHARDFQRLLAAVNAAAGWGESGSYAKVVFCGNEKSVNAAVVICGEGETVSAWGKDQVDALVNLLQKIESHHYQHVEWHLARRKLVQRVLDELDIYYVKVEAKS